MRGSIRASTSSFFTALLKSTSTSVTCPEIWLPTVTVEIALSVPVAEIATRMSPRSTLTVRHADAAWRLWRDSRQALEAVRASTAKVRRAYALGEAGIAELIAAQRQEQESALAESDARANALEAALLIRVDAHELWHDAGDNDA